MEFLRFELHDSAYGSTFGRCVLDVMNSKYSSKDLFRILSPKSDCMSRQSIDIAFVALTEQIDDRRVDG